MTAPRALVGLVALAAAASGCRGAFRAPVLAPGTPVVLVTIDTLRADHLPAYGYRAVATPHLDALAREGVLFENAWTPSPLTLPAHASLLTGRLPEEHGLRNNLGYTLAPGRHATLQGLLRARGYATGAAVSAYVLRGETGLRDGFDVYDEVPAATVATDSAGRVQRAGPETASRLLAFARGTLPRPVFLFLHLYEPHLPYEPPEPFRGAAAHPYDGEIAAADAVLGTFVAELKRAGVYDRALVVLGSDHGEGLGDHGEADHGILLYREALHVPLIVKLPGGDGAGRRVREPVGLVDVLPTVAAVLGLEAPADLPGRSLFTAVPGRMLFAETFYPRIHLGWSELRSVADDRHHLIAGRREELFDLQRDVAERSDVLAREPAAAARLRRELERHAASLEAPREASAEASERLRALGYLAGPGPDVNGERPDPRDELPLLQALRTAFGLAAAGRDAEAATAFREVLSGNDRLFDAQFGLAESLARLGRHDEADAAFARAQELWPSPSVEIARARARVALDRAAADLAANRAASALRLLDGARARLADAKAGPLRDLEFLRGDAFGRLNRLREAQAAFEEEIRLYPDNSTAYARLAVVWGLQGRKVSEVHRLLESMQARSPGAETALLAARTLDSMGDRAGAAAWRARAGGNQD
jgi:arylsulfatase A-like enzyme